MLDHTVGLTLWVRMHSRKTDRARKASRVVWWLHVRESDVINIIGPIVWLTVTAMKDVVSSHSVTQTAEITKLNGSWSLQQLMLLDVA